jgi:hypothetical protein
MRKSPARSSSASSAGDSRGRRTCSPLVDSLLPDARFIFQLNRPSTPFQTQGVRVAQRDVGCTGWMYRMYWTVKAAIRTGVDFTHKTECVITECGLQPYVGNQAWMRERKKSSPTKKERAPLSRRANRLLEGPRTLDRVLRGPGAL